MKVKNNFEVPSVNGILLVDKPREWTSHDVCAFVKKRFRIKKVGHAGTLDPLATGLLILLLGKATRLSNELSAYDKEYAGVMELGVKTDSHDRQGQVIEETAWEHVKLEEIRAEVENFTGDIMQVPPMVSALKHQGVRLYKLARQGQTVPRDSRPVKVYEFHIEKKDGRFVYLSTRVSKGTYVRTLINDLGESLGCLAALAELRRTRCGSYDIRDSVSIDFLRNVTLDGLRKKVLFHPSSASYAHSERS